MALSVAMLFTSVDCMSVHAQELAGMISPVSEDEKPDTSGEGEITKDEPSDGTAVITSFQELSEEDLCIKLTGEKRALDDVLALMPETLTANVEYAASVSENAPEGDTMPGEGEVEPGEEEKPGEDATKPGEEEQPGEGGTEPGEGDQPGEGETQPGEGDQPGEGETQPGEGDQPGEGETEPGEDDQPGGDVQPGEGEQPGAEDSDGQDVPDSGNGGGENGGSNDGSGYETGEERQDGDSGERESQSLAPGNDAAAAKSRTLAADGQRWRLLVETGENSNGPVDSEGDGRNEGDSNGNEGGVEGSTGGNEGDEESGIEDGEGADGSETGEGENTPPDIEPGVGTDIPNEENPDAVPPVKGDTVKTEEIPVTWKCETYETEEADSYTFVPEWDETKWSLAESAKDTVPTIEVVYVAPESEVSTEEELVAAFAAGYGQITLTEDIFLSKPLYLPAGVDITLDGCGYSLLRGKVTEEGEETQSPETFAGVMIAMDGEGYTEDTYGTLTLKDITVNGGTEVDRAGAPAILDRGNLILDEGAVVSNNYNYGTYPKEGEEEKEAVPDYGGGIQVYGELTLSPEALVTENFADEFGGGIYLAEGAVLNLYADVIVANSVGEGHGYGADLYAAPGSVIYYDPSVDMEREGFYICKGAILVPMGIAQIDLPEDRKKEVYISVSEDSGYSEEEVAALKAGLEALGYTIITNRRTDIDTTDLRNWYVYDHYDTDETCWGAGTMAAPPQKWLDVYGGGEKRKFYPWKETRKKNVKNPASTIEEWLGRLGDTIEADNYMGDRYPLDQVQGIAPVLSNFKEHIYTRNQDGCPTMTFVGYGWPAYVDFLFYDPESDGEKVVDFDVDSSDIFTHTMVGSGFLVNTGVNDKNQLSGYLVYYAYAGAEYPKDPTNTKARSVTIYRMDGVDADKLHGVGADVDMSAIGKGDFYYINSRTRPAGIEGFEGFTEIVRKEITEWDDQMSVQIKVAPDRIEVRQQPKSESKDISECEPILDVTLSQLSGYSGFGPLVAYTHVGHVCMMASGFTFSNLRMYFTDPELEQKDMLNPLEEADFTQEGTQKYFINLFGDSDLDYNDTANFGQYQEYMKMMQKEGIVLITDRETPFDPYLGDPDDPYSNLVELKDGGKLSVDELIEKIKNSIADDRTTTRLDDKLANPPDAGGLTEATPGQSVGNIWLQAEGGQVRETLQGTAFGGSGYEIRIMDDITYYHGDPSGLTVSYDILKPGKVGYTPLSTAKPSEGASFTVTRDTKEWHSGRYIVRQTISGSAIHGYAYFDLKQPSTPVDPPVTYPVRVNVTAWRDGSIWTDSGRLFKLRPSGGGDLIDPSSGTVPEGNYVVYDVTESEEGVDTGVPVTAANADKADTEIIVYVDYYTVTFYDGSAAYGMDTPQKPVIVLKGKKVAEPETPDKAGYIFTGWKTGDGGSTPHDFEQAVTQKTDIYASWTPMPVNKVTAAAGKGGQIDPAGAVSGEEMQTVTVRQEAVPKAENDQTPTGGGEPKTGDAAPTEIYATAAMIAGLTYLLLYFMEESRGMTEREKEVFVAAFIRWAKKGGRFRRCCAIAAIFCLLVYYHSIGKRAGRVGFDRECLRQSL